MMLPNMTREEWEPVNAGVAAALAGGTLRPAVGREFPLADAPAAHEAVLAAGATGKIVLVP
jgi:NADPH:quinone reductase